MMGDEIIKVVELLSNSTSTVVLTGAGMSTESGIPDFRSSEGIYSKFPADIFSLTTFKHTPELFYQAFEVLYQYKLSALPNIGHKILAKWESMGLTQTLITQNIDGLHQKAGHKAIIPIHGNMNSATCQNRICRKKYEIHDIINQKAFYCDCHDGRNSNNLIKPDVVLFEEQVPLIEKAINAVRNCDLFIVLGTSLSVYPVAGLIMYVKQNSHVVIINNSSTVFDERRNTIAVHAPIGETLQKIDSTLDY